MRSKYRIYLVDLILSLFISGLVYLLVLSALVHKQGVELFRLQTNLQNSVGELALILNQYLLYQDEATGEKWNAKLMATNSILADQRRVLGDEEPLLKSVSTNLNNLHVAFVRLTETFGEMAKRYTPVVNTSESGGVAVIEQAARAGDVELAGARKQASELVLIQQTLQSDAMRLSESPALKGPPVLDFIAAYPIFPIVIGLLAIGLLLLNGYRLTVRLRQPSGAVLSALEPEDVLVGFPQRDEAKRMTGISQLALPSTLVPEVTTRPAEFGSLLYAIDSISDLVMVVDAIGEIHTLNHAFERATGWTREEWVGKALGGLILPQDAPKLDDTIELAVKQETPKTASIHIRTKDDRFVIVELTARPVKQQDPIADVLLIGKLETRYGWPSWSRLAE